MIPVAEIIRPATVRILIMVFVCVEYARFSSDSSRSSKDFTFSITGEIF